MFDSPSSEYSHIIDLFDREQIYGTFQTVTSFDNNQNFLCFYFGLKDFITNSRTFTIQNGHNRNLELEKILHTVSIIFDIASISLTYVSLRKLRLITKEVMKNMYLNPKDSKLSPLNNTAIMERKYNASFMGKKFQMPDKPIQYKYNSSLNDDLEDFLESIRCDGFQNDSKHIFLMKMLSASEMKQLQFKDEDFINTFYNEDFDISTEIMLKSNSKSKYAFWSGFRTSVNIPSNDFPFVDAAGFSFPLFGNPWVDPFRVFKEVKVHKNGNADWRLSIKMDRHLNHPPLITQINPAVYCLDYDSAQHFAIEKIDGEYEVFFQEEYVKAYDFVDVEALKTETLLYMCIVDK